MLCPRATLAGVGPSRHAFATPPTRPSSPVPEAAINPHGATACSVKYTSTLHTRCITLPATP
ncbi:hypothetical protein BV25DRAFT_1824097 [Artomyces pyxidatus]|uniref:Uncharacterized protein n=1 Tax=Artomyces pyxidatus TaxID=48021 RepID=A0ACB8T4E1_9AGAM|nr:hypothetical protein BV25DRAFT_1824097 [Artomyces pyxidatus]